MKLKTWCAGVAISGIISITGILILSFLMYRFRWGEAMLTVPVAAIQGAAAFSGGFLIGKNAPARRFLWGLGYGALLFLLLLLISLLAGGQVDGDLSSLLITAGVCLGGGMLGAMFG